MRQPFLKNAAISITDYSSNKFKINKRYPSQCLTVLPLNSKQWLHGTKIKLLQGDWFFILRPNLHQFEFSAALRPLRTAKKENKSTLTT